MENFEQPKKQPKTLNCDTIKVANLSILEKDGWEQAYSFHNNNRNRDQRDLACEKVDEIQKDGLWKAVVAFDLSDEASVVDGVVYVYKTKTEKYHQEEEITNKLREERRLRDIAKNK